MKSAVETLAPTRVKMTVEVPYEELKPSIDAAIKEIGAQIALPGFRPGKVPAKLIEQRVGRGAVIQEAVNSALPQLYGQALEENDVRPLGQPEVDITAVPVAEGDPLTFTAELDVRPEIELPAYDSISVTVDPTEESAVAEEAEQRMTMLRQRFGTLLTADRPAATGDFLTIDLRGVIDGNEIDAVEGVSYEVGSGTMLEGLDEALVGLKADEEKTFKAPLAGGEHEGEQADITVKVTAVKERELPELDDEFAQLASEFDTLEELRADLTEQAKRAKMFEQGVQARDKVLDHLLETLDFPVPESIVEAEVERHLQSEGRSEDDEHRTEVTEETRKSLRTQLLLDAIAEKEQVEVTQQELIEYLVMTAQQYGMEPGEFAQAIDQNDQVPAMAGEVARRKALAAVLEQVEVVDTTGAVVDLNAPADGEDADDEADKPAEKKPAKKAAAKKSAPKAPAADESEEDAPADAEAPAEDDAEKPAKKTAAKKTAAKKTTAKKTAAKKTAATKTAAKKTTAKDTAAKKTTKKAATKKTAAKPAEGEQA